MGELSAMEITIAFAVATLIGFPALVLLHELAHALAIRLRGLPLHVLAVGDADDLVVRTRGVILRFGRSLDPTSGVAGLVRFDATRATRADVIVIALAGPLANAGAALVLAAIASKGGTHGAANAALWLLAVSSAASTVENLVPRGTPGSASEPMNDGRIVQLAWRHRLVSLESAPERPVPRPAAEPGLGLRPPYAIALAIIAVLAVVAGGIGLLLPIVILFGVAYLYKGHRDKVC